MISAEVIDLLEFDRVRKYISKYVSTYNGQKIVENLFPLTNLAAINHKGNLVSEAKNILIENGEPPITFIDNLSEPLSLSRISGALLKRKDIYGILELLQISRKTYQFLSNIETDKLCTASFGEIIKFKNKLINNKEFEKKINNVFTDSGEISDNASSKLKEIRNDIVSKGEGLRKVIGKILKKLSENYLVQEEYVTQREGRIVLPIKAEHKRHVRGFIHSESATGKTVYIEPEETLELNNEILSLGFAEKREIERILRSLTQLIGEKSTELNISLKAISELDAIFAFARYSQEIMGSFPTINNDMPLEIINGYHPILLEKNGIKNTVPLNIKISSNKIILITGPNAGGKTVVLKTLGLIYLMVLSGIHAPIAADSNLNWVDNILADIGDRQSLEDDLSTFSSHLSNINNILNIANECSLVLLDEIGTGTDPSEGSALATQALIELRDRKSITLATTHHGNLKIIANEMDGFQNASMEFDSELLKPTYKFVQGLPGASYAFEVAKRIGFSDSFLSQSQDYLDKKNSKIEELLIELQKKSNELQHKLNKSEIENSRLSGLTNLYKQKIEKLEKQKNDIIKKTADAAEEYLSDVNRQVESTIKNLRESNANRETIVAEKKKLEKIKIRNKKLFKKSNPEKSHKNFVPKIGGFAKVINTQTSGEIVDIDKSKNRAALKVGSIKLQVKISQLEYFSQSEQKITKLNNPIYHITNLNSTVLDIRGQKPEEAEYSVIKFIDDAYSSNVERVEILHGKGTGALKKMVHIILKQHEYVKNYYFAKVEFGGEGITIIEMK